MQKLVIAAFLGWSVMASAEVKIGFVDMQRAIQDTSDGQHAKKELEADFNKKKKELEKKQNDIKKMSEDLDKKAMVLSDDVKAKKQQDIQQEMGKYQEEVSKSQMDIQKHERDLTQPIIGKLRKIIDEIAKKESYTAIMEKSDQLVIYSIRDLDLTDRIIHEYDIKK